MGSQTGRLALYFTGPGRVEVREAAVPEPAPGQVLVQAVVSAISAGTEMLVYRGDAPAHLPADLSLKALSDKLTFPFKYGYSAVGRVVSLGAGVDSGWEGRTVFAFNPHESFFTAEPADLLPLPAGIPAEEAVFLPNMETALGLVMDGRPLIGEQAAVFGQGVVGLLTTALLARFPLATLVTLDRYPRRRRVSLELGAHVSLDPASRNALEECRNALQGFGEYTGADLTYELSGNPLALDQAIAISGFNGRVIVGSWYGRRADLDLGAHFHRNRITLTSSQVSTICPELTGRWRKARRFQAAWQAIERLKPSRLVTHRFPIAEAARAYRLLDENPGEAIQVLLEY